MPRHFPLFLLLAVPAAVCASTSSINLTSSAAVAEYGHPVTLTATVSPAAATGKVTFYLGTTILDTEPLSNGVATLTTTLLPSGEHTLTAYYGGDTTDAPSASKALLEKVKTVPSDGFTAPILTS